MTERIHYAAIKMDEAFYEDVIIERLCDEHGYTHLYGPDVERTSDKYDDVFLPGVLATALKRVNPNLPRQAIQDALLKLNDVGGWVARPAQRGLQRLPVDRRGGALLRRQGGAGRHSIPAGFRQSR